MYATRGAPALRRLLGSARPLAEVLIEDRLTHLQTDQAVDEALRVVAAGPSRRWSSAARTVSQRTGRPPAEVDRLLLGHVRAWNTDPRGAAATALQDVPALRTRLELPDQAPTAATTARRRSGAEDRRPPTPTSPARSAPLSPRR